MSRHTEERRKRFPPEMEEMAQGEQAEKANPASRLRTVEKGRGLRGIDFAQYVRPHDPQRLVQESSAVGDYDDAFDRPYSSALWVGPDLHLWREDVAELVAHLQTWLDTGRLMQPKELAP